MSLVPAVAEQPHPGAAAFQEHCLSRCILRERCRDRCEDRCLTCAKPVQDLVCFPLQASPRPEEGSVESFLPLRRPAGISNYGRIDSSTRNCVVPCWFPAAPFWGKCAEGMSPRLAGRGVAKACRSLPEHRRALLTPGASRASRKAAQPGLQVALVSKL